MLRTVRMTLLLLNNDGVEEKLIGLSGGGGIRLNQKTQFPLQDHVSVYTYRNEHDLFRCFHAFELDMPMVLSTY